MSVGGYGKIERGDTDIPFSRLQQIAEVLNTSIINLVEDGKFITSFVAEEDMENNVVIQKSVNQIVTLYEARLQDKDKEINHLKDVVHRLLSQKE
jgi:transcriptional regulator with XRE-family HTH domain